MITETAIDEFIVKLRLQAIIEGIDENTALAYAAARLRLATGEITKHEYYNLVDEINHTLGISSELHPDKSLKLSYWIEQQISRIPITQLS